MEIQRFDVLRWKGDPSLDQRIIWTDYPLQRIGTIDIAIGIKRINMTTPTWQSYDEILDAIQTEQAVIIVDRYRPIIRADDTNYEKHIAKRDEHWALIAPILFDTDGQFRLELFEPDIRGLLIRDTLKRYPTIREPWLRVLLTRVLQGTCSPNDLFPRYPNCGAPGKSRQGHYAKRGKPNVLTELIGENGINIKPDDIDKAKKAFSMYEKGRLPSLPAAHQWMLERYYHCGHSVKNGVITPQMPAADDVMSPETFAKLYQQLRDVIRSVIGRSGQHHYDTIARPIFGSVDDPLGGIGMVYVDATIPDIWLVSSKDPLLIIGKPTLHIAVTSFLMFAGFSTTLTGPRYSGAMSLLDNMNCDKVQLCAEHDIQIDDDDWPWHYIPEGVTADRAELLSKHGSRWTIEPNIQQATTAPYRPEWKWSVEGSFNLLEQAGLDDVPGSPDAHDIRQGSKYIYDAQLTVHQFNKLIIILLLDFMHTFEVKQHPLADELISRGIKPTPIEMFRYIMTNYSGVLRHEDPERLRKQILKKDTGSIHQRKGIYFNKLYYTCERALEEGWFVVRPGRKRGQHVDVLYDERLVDAIYVRRKDDRDWIKCRLRDDYARRYGGMSFVEVALLQKRARQVSLASRTDTYQHRADSHAQKRALLDEAKRRKDAREAEATNSLPTKQQRRDATHRQDERRKMANDQAWVKPDEQPTIAEIPVQESDESQLQVAQEIRRQRLLKMRLPINEDIVSPTNTRHTEGNKSENNDIA